MPPIECSRSLLFPGPQPPLSHFGATLLRHVLATGLRYSLHSLGLPMPERPPVRIVRLRVYLAPAKLLEQLEPGETSEEIAAALVDPAGSGALPTTAAHLRGALAFHRTRLRLRTGHGPGEPEPLGKDATPAALWRAFRSQITRFQGVLNDALLAELIAALTRRAERHVGKTVEPCLGREAYRLRAGKRCDLTSLGVPDPMALSWDRAAGADSLVRERLQDSPVPPRHRLRGGFRESYRRALSLAREPYVRLARSARDSGLLESPADAFFIPFDLAEDLAGDTRPGWLPEAVTSNRLEYQTLLGVGGPPELIGRGESKSVVEDEESWPIGPVSALD